MRIAKRAEIIKLYECKSFSSRRTCRFCGYSGNDWSDSDECPSCGEVN